MHSVVTVTLAAEETAQSLAAIDAAFAEIDRLERILSEWKEGSQVATVNARAGGDPVGVDDEVFGVIEAAHSVSVKSEGAFDVTVGALWGAWDFRWEEPRIPTDEELAPRLARIDYRKVELDREAKTVRLAKPGMKLALGGIAKGYAIDRASAVLKAEGFGDHLVVAGGDLFASGRRGDQRWRVGVRDPRSGDIHSIVALENEGLATSGNYEKFFERDGVRYHHLLEPRTGRPARGVASATVLAPTATLADAWATAFFVLGIDRSLALAPELEGIDVVLFDEETFATSGTPALLARLEPPG